jgi:hypothetical protein
MKKDLSGEADHHFEGFQPIVSTGAVHQRRIGADDLNEEEFTEFRLSRD